MGLGSIVGFRVCVHLERDRKADEEPKLPPPPLGDGSIEEENGKIIVKLPRSTEKKSMHQWRFLQEVQGDFVAQVKVTGDLNPEMKATAVGPEAPAPFRLAGLIVAQDGKNSIRITHHHVYHYGLRMYQYHLAKLEYMKDGVWQTTNLSQPSPGLLKDRSIWIRVERKGSKVFTYYHREGRGWSKPVEKLTVDLTDKVWVGVAALNHSVEPFTVEFDEFKVDKK